MTTQRVDWRTYERFVARMQSNAMTEDITVIPNARLIGSISGIERQIDVLIDARWGEDINRRIIVDAKKRRRKLDVKDVEEFEGMMRDCRARHGILVCPSGYSPAALIRAQDAISIKLVPLEAMESLDLNAWDPCYGNCSSHDARHSEPGFVLWDSPFGLFTADSPVSIVAVGKCDVCNEFNIWCWNCGARFALSDEDEYKCSCDWFWLTAIEEEIDDTTDEALSAVHLFLCLLNGVIFPVDRRPLQ